MLFLSPEACEAIRALRRVAATERGGAPAYSEWHVIEALRIMSKGAVGRLSLSSELGIGEASARTLLTRLEEEGLVKAVGRGKSLTDRGVRVLRQLEDLLSVTACSIKDLSGFEECLKATFIGNPPVDLTQVYDLRDLLVARGCKTSLIGYWRGEEVGFPGMPQGILDLVLRSISLPAEGVGGIIVVPSSCWQQLVGALAELTLRFCERA
ncbi:MAG: hypothetical protein ACP5HK_01550 [Acidilobus sp.]